MDPKWIQILFDWASLNRYVTRLWIFGSRARGGPNHPSSDLDIAIEVKGSMRDSAHTRFMFNRDAWFNDLQSRLVVEIEVHHYEEGAYVDDEGREGIVVSAVQDHGILIYASTDAHSEGPIT